MCGPKLILICVWLSTEKNVCFYILLKNSGFRVMFTRPTNTFSVKKTLKSRLTTLFIYLKIILLQYFQFSIFSNNWYPNRRYVVYTKKIYYVYSIYVSIIFQQYRFLVAYIVLAKMFKLFYY